VPIKPVFAEYFYLILQYQRLNAMEFHKCNHHY